MATASRPRWQSQLEAIERTHPLWTQYFSAGQRSEMIKDDLLAGKSVSTILIAVVSVGLFAVLVTLLSVL
jgi:hypothetical protein